LISYFSWDAPAIYLDRTGLARMSSLLQAALYRAHFARRVYCTWISFNWGVILTTLEQHAEKNGSIFFSGFSGILVRIPVGKNKTRVYVIKIFAPIFFGAKPTPHHSLRLLGSYAPR
jgi:hypothetical protein